ncbi:TonB-dependent receptor [Sphingomonas sp.]|uniref:TonB-dependent receptor n=1 Tax=Sphingomonas sp. TaxID=28214 RepID=UPI0025CC87A5|nr:TonB-dependent receptor [Sphingomonas sp.]
MKRFDVRVGLVCGAAVGALGAAPGWSQAAPASVGAEQPAKASGDTAEDVGAIVVTARRSAEKLRDVPSTVNVVTGAAITAIGPIQTTGDILSRSPGVRFNNLQNPLLSEVTIRGSGSGRASGADPSVGLFANGVYVGGGGFFGRNFSLVDSFDLERAEVLSGPQGALYGRNAEYGVVNLVSAKPTQKVEGSIANAYTFETNSNRLTAILNYPIANDLSIRVGAQYLNQDKGFVYNPVRKEYYDVTEGWMGRAQVRYNPGKLDLNFAATFEHLDLPAYQQVGYILPGTIAQFPNGFFQDRYSIPIDAANKSHENIGSYVLSGSYDLDWAELSSTTSYRRRYDSAVRGFTQNTIDLATLRQLWATGAAGAYPLSGTDQTTVTKMWYQDVHLAGKLMDDRLSWTAGGEYLHYDTNFDNQQRQDPCATAARPNLTINQGVCGGTAAAPVCYQLTSTSGSCPANYPSPFGFRTITDTRYKSWAIYGSLSFKLTERLTVTGDGRYTHDDKHQDAQYLNLYTNAQRTFATGGTIPSTSYDYKKNIATWTATANYRFPGQAGLLLYGKVGTGYRAGDFNSNVTPPLVNGLLGGRPAPAGYAPVTPTYGAEKIISYEAGIKGNILPQVFGTLTGYVSRQKDALAVVGDGCAQNNACVTNAANYVVNAGDVHAEGIEATLDARADFAGGKLNAQINASRQWAKYVNVPITRPGLAAGQATGLPLEDTPVSQNPEWLLSVSVNYRHPVTDDIDVFANVLSTSQWGGIQDPATAAIPGIRLDNFTNVNLRAGMSYKALELSLIVNNLTSQTHTLLIAAQRSTVAGLPYIPTSYRYAYPRTFGLELRYHF